jgi:hypothetical protein
VNSSKNKKPKVETKATYLLYTKSLIDGQPDLPLDIHTFPNFQATHPQLAQLLLNPDSITEAEIIRVVTTKE